MGYKGVIFDLDGVLCSTDQFHYQAWKKIADMLGIYFDEVINRRLKGVSRMESLEIILEKSDREFTSQEKQKLAEQKNCEYRKLLSRMSPEDIPENVTKVLRRLRERKILTAVGSSNKNAEYILEKTELKEMFDAVADGNCITHSKPNPEVFQKASAMLRLRPEECLVVEDSAAGIDAALAGGFGAAGIGDAKNYNYRKAVYSLCKLEDILEILEED